MDRNTPVAEVKSEDEPELFNWAAEHGVKAQKIVNGIGGAPSVYILLCPNEDITLLAKLRYGRSTLYDCLIKSIEN